MLPPWKDLFGIIGVAGKNILKQSASSISVSSKHPQLKGMKNVRRVKIYLGMHAERSQEIGKLYTRMLQ